VDVRPHAVENGGVGPGRAGAQCRGRIFGHQPPGAGVGHQPVCRLPGRRPRRAAAQRRGRTGRGRQPYRPRRRVAAWTQDRFRGIVAGVSADRRRTWRSPGCPAAPAGPSTTPTTWRSPPARTAWCTCRPTCSTPTASAAACWPPGRPMVGGAGASPRCWRRKPAGATASTPAGSSPATQPTRARSTRWCPASSTCLSRAIVGGRLGFHGWPVAVEGHPPHPPPTPTGAGPQCSFLEVVE
jgi:hypothetical protein